MPQLGLELHRQLRAWEALQLPAFYHTFGVSTVSAILKTTVTIYAIQQILF